MFLSSFISGQSLRGIRTTTPTQRRLITGITFVSHSFWEIPDVRSEMQQEHCQATQGNN